MPSLPEIVGHRGSPRERRENTLPGFALALDQGAGALELDVHATSDGVVVVHHDPVVGPAAEPSAVAGRAVAAMTSAELRGVALPPGADGVRTFAPTLDELVDLVGDRATLYVEIKAPGIEREVLGVLARARGPVAVHGFDHRVSHRVAGLAPLPTGILVYSRLVDPVHALRGARARDYWCWWEFIDDETVELVHGAGGRVVAWTVNDVAAAHRLAAMGVDALCTDVPGALYAALAGRRYAS